MSTLNNLRRFWNTRVAWNCLSNVITDERERMHILQLDTEGGLMSDYTALLVADNNGERLAVYGYEGSHPYTLSGNEDVWERIDGKRLSKRPEHFVLNFTDHNGYQESAHGADLEGLLNDFLVEDEEDFEQGFDDNWPAWVDEVMLARCAIAMPTRNNPVKLTITTCTCAGHEYIGLLD